IARTFMVVAASVGVWAALATAASPQGPIRIGASLSLTGPYAPFGQNRLRGYQLCFKHMNEKGGVLGRKLELVVEDDQSEPATAVRIYENLITQGKVDAILGPYSSPITDAVADVSEKHKMPMVSPGGDASSIYQKGRRFVFLVQSPGDAYLEGFIDLAAKRGLRTLAVINEDTLFPKATAQGTLDLAKKKGLQVILAETYPKGTTDFAPILTKVQAANPDVLAAPGYFDDAVAITRQLKEMNVNARMFGLATGVDLQKFYEVLGRTTEFVYGSSQWQPELVTVRAGGLVPIAREYPGAREFVEAYRQEFPRADLSYHSASGYGGCQVLLEAIRRANSLNSERIRGAILRLDINTVFGAFKVNKNGLQIAHKTLIFQWQDGKKVIVWPDELAPGKPRFPTPPWKERP
ncbi:MAG TPA: amino acid ABC transporter substrate-binding protein, partial [Candidatus Acidoferrum sp.]|nr:amino acid ABC transporter substrate-binding protein [Candidatus Acidoferrum sp.]